MSAAASPTSCSQPARHVKAGTPLVQLFDAPEQGDLANFKAQATVAQLSLDRAKQLAARQFGPQATVDQRAGRVRPGQGRHRQDRRRSSRRSWCARRSTASSACARSRSASSSPRARQIVTLTDLSTLYANFTVTEKDSGQLKVGQTVRSRGRRLSRPQLRGQDHHDRAADRHRHAQHPRAGDDRQSRTTS